MPKNSIEDVAIIGAGRVGLTYGSCLASKGMKVHLYEKDVAKRRRISRRELPFFEPNLGELLRKVLGDGSLQLVPSAEHAIGVSDLTFISVGTPSRRTGNIDLSQVRDSTREIGVVLGAKKSYHIVVVQSTVAPGTTLDMVKPMLERLSSREAIKDFGLAMQPEFLREGSAIDDVFHPSRIVVGALDAITRTTLVDLSKRLCGRWLPRVVQTNPTTAEMIKYASNAFLATKISFINEIANICERAVEVDIVDVATGIGLDPRIGPNYLGAGIGFGGSCLPKDLTAYISYGRSIGYQPLLLQAVRTINRRQPGRAVDMAKECLGKLARRRIAVLGLTFKPNTDDLRDSPSFKVIERLLREGCEVSVFDPRAMGEARKVLGSRVAYAHDAYRCVRDTECCFVCTPWEEFKSLDLKKLGSLMKMPLIVDGRRLYDPKRLPRELRYRGIGASARLAWAGSRPRSTTIAS
jgi:UDPglucose 6-dehydrogenase